MKASSVIVGIVLIAVIIFAAVRWMPGKELVSEIPDVIRVTSPKPNDIVSNTIEIVGEARGFWFFEASFPVALIDSEGVRHTSYIMTSENWMTEEFVPFEATVSFPDAAAGKATLILQKDNPSGLPENDAELRIPVMIF